MVWDQPLDRLPLKGRFGPALWAIALFGGLVRLGQGLLISVPSNDGASYLSMVEAFAGGHFGQGFSYVFPPGSALLVAPLAAATGDSLLAFILTGTLAAVLGILWLGKAARHWLTPQAGLFAAALLALLHLSVRSPGEAYSETFFVPLLCGVLLALAKNHRPLAGLLLGLGFWLRPEALALSPLLLAPPAQRGHPCFGRRISLVSLGLALGLMLVCAASLPLLRLLLSPDASPFPKFTLMRPMGPLGAGSFEEGLSLFLARFSQLPASILQGLDFGIPLLALPGMFFLRRRSSPLAAALLLALLLATSAQLLFQVKPRFFVDQAPLWILVSAAVLLHEAWVWRFFLGASLLSSGAALVHDFLVPPRVEKHLELQVGTLLRQEPLTQKDLVTDMPRVAWSAGLIPAPPLIWTQARLRQAIQRQKPRFIVLGVKRRGRRSLAQELQDRYSPWPFPPRFQKARGRDRILVLEKLR